MVWYSEVRALHCVMINIVKGFSVVNEINFFRGLGCIHIFWVHPLVYYRSQNIRNFCYKIYFGIGNGILQNIQNL